MTAGCAAENASHLGLHRFTRAYTTMWNRRNLPRWSYLVRSSTSPIASSSVRPAFAPVFRLQSMFVIEAVEHPANEPVGTPALLDLRDLGLDEIEQVVEEAGEPPRRNRAGRRGSGRASLSRAADSSLAPSKGRRFNRCDAGPAGSPAGVPEESLHDLPRDHGGGAPLQRWDPKAAVTTR